MTRYEYRAYGRDGTSVAGEVDGINKGEAYELLIHRGLTPLSISPKQSRRSISKIDRRPFSEFAANLGQLLSAGLEVDTALNHLYETEKRGPLKQAIQRLHEAVVAGTPVSKALKTAEFGEPDYVAGVIAAGETSGDLGNVWMSVAKVEAQKIATANALRSAFIYPVFLIIFAFASIIMVLTVVAPAIKPILIANKSAAPEVLALVNTSDWLIANWQSLVLVSLVGSLLLVIWFRSELGLKFFQRLVLRIPWIGPLVRNRESSRFLSTLAMLIDAGMPLPQALKLASSSVGNRVIRARLVPLGEAVRDGQTLAASVRSSAALPDLAIKLIEVGEHTGRIAELLSRGANVLAIQSDRLQKNLVSFLTPALTLLLGVMVGTVVITILTAIMGINDVGL